MTPTIFVFSLLKAKVCPHAWEQQQPFEMLPRLLQILSLYFVTLEIQTNYATIPTFIHIYIVP